jgi:hypothetical protein
MMTLIKFNQRLMTVLFFIPLAVIALWESIVEQGALKDRYMQSWLAPVPDCDSDNEETRNPDIGEDEGGEWVDGIGVSGTQTDNGGEGLNGGDTGVRGGGRYIGEGGDTLQISKVKFEDLCSVFPNAALVRRFSALT